MAFDPWYKVATPRKEVREGRSFNPDQFAIDDPRLPVARREHHAMETIPDVAQYAVAPFAVVLTVVFPS